MKILFTFIITYFFTVSLCASQSNAKSLRHIPLDAHIVASIQTQDLNKKVDWTKIRAIPTIKKGIDNLAALSGDNRKHIQRFFLKPDEYGIALNKGVQGFFQSAYVAGPTWKADAAKNEVLYTGLILTLSDQSSFEKTLYGIFNIKKASISQGKNYQYCQLNKIIIAWNSNHLLFYSCNKAYAVQQLEKRIAILFDGKSSLLNNKDFKSFSKQKNDASVWINLKALVTRKNNARALHSANINEPSIAYTGDYIHIGINFEKGKITTKSQTIFSEDRKKATNQLAIKKPSEALLSHIDTNKLLGVLGGTMDINSALLLLDTTQTSFQEKILRYFRDALVAKSTSQDTTLLKWADTAARLELSRDSSEIHYERLDSIWNKIELHEKQLISHHNKRFDSLFRQSKKEFNIPDGWFQIFSGEFALFANQDLKKYDTVVSYEYQTDNQGDWKYTSDQVIEENNSLSITGLIGFKATFKGRQLLKNLSESSNTLNPTPSVLNTPVYCIEDDIHPLFITYTENNYLIISNNIAHLKKPENTLITAKDKLGHISTSAVFAYLDFKKVFEYAENEYGENAFTKLGIRYLETMDSKLYSDKKSSLSNVTNINFSEKDNSFELLVRLSADLYALFLEENTPPNEE